MFYNHQKNKFILKQLYTFDNLEISSEKVYESETLV